MGVSQSAIYRYGLSEYFIGKINIDADVFTHHHMVVVVVVKEMKSTIDEVMSTTLPRM